MSETRNQLEAEWVNTLGASEDQIRHILSTVPKDRLLDYTKNLTEWSRRISDDAVIRAYRVLTAMGYSKATCATTLGVHYQTLDIMLARYERGEERPKRRRYDRPEPPDAIDVSERFDRAYAER